MNKKLLAKEITKIASILVGIEFESEEEKKKYLDEHDPKPGTKLEVVKEEDKKEEKPKKQKGDSDKAERTKKHMDEGLKGWVKDYKELTQKGYTNSAKQLKDSIDHAIKKNKLDKKLVYGE